MTGAHPRDREPDNCWIAIRAAFGLRLGTSLRPAIASLLRRLTWVVVLWSLTACGPAALQASTDYQTVSPSPDGIGRVYLGREIAQTMGHEGAGWLDRPSRALQERPQAAIEALGLAPTDVVADIGAGTGYFARRIAPLVPQGRVLAVDIQPEMLALLQTELAARGIENVEPVLGEPDSPNLPPGSVDLALLVDAYHEFAYPREVMEGVVVALKPGGRVVLAEYRAENPLVMIKRLHKMSVAQVRREMAAVGLDWVKTDDRLPEQHLLFFQKSAEQPV
ncbi:class I SAM-dependent methyltransferase [Nodosilinea sp. PGN35]|uniref:class I SAM-dependent methyltransferase n=1 Tax=Nodosilinea sp. PGN35 TaxID=3020489 RepID=UPI0023B24BE1|nr:class I SAM-dependent methyltransferase [Nodosilinea sp. TSF1-S3]MDF0367383.1 class I SAM-dependent methyltransferase [Nodosilinea sp. TSF1-S3]